MEFPESMGVGIVMFGYASDAFRLEDGARMTMCQYYFSSRGPVVSITTITMADGTQIRGDEDGPWWDWVRDIVRRKKAEKEKAKLEAETKRKEELERLAVRFEVVPSGSTIRYCESGTDTTIPLESSYPKFEIGDEVVGQPSRTLSGPFLYSGEIYGTIDLIDGAGLWGAHYRVKVSTGQLKDMSIWLDDKGLRKAEPEPAIPTRYENMSQWDKLMSFLHLR